MHLFRRPKDPEAELDKEIGRLSGLLKGRDAGLKRGAAVALAEIGGPRAVAALCESLTLFRQSRQQQGLGPEAANALGYIGDMAAFECLLDCVGDHTWSPVEEAKQALERLPRAELVHRLYEALEGSDPKRGTTAAEMLGYLRDPSTLDALTAALGDRAHLEDIAGFRGNKPVEILIGALGHPNRNVRMDATSRLIGGTGPFDQAERLAARINSETVDRLAYALEVGDRDTRWLAADFLAIRRPQSEAVVSALAGSLGFGDGDLVRKVLAALVAIGGPDAAAAMKQFAADPPLPAGWNRDADWQQVRREWQALALHALEQVSPEDFAGARSALAHTPGGPAGPPTDSSGTDVESQIPPLSAELRDSDWRARFGAVGALGRLGAAAIPHLQQALADPYTEQRYYQEPDSFGDVQWLGPRWEFPVRVAAEEALIAMGTPAARLALADGKARAAKADASGGPREEGPPAGPPPPDSVRD